MNHATAFEFGKKILPLPSHHRRLISGCCRSCCARPSPERALRNSIQPKCHPHSANKGNPPRSDSCTTHNPICWTPSHLPRRPCHVFQSLDRSRTTGERGIAVRRAGDPVNMRWIPANQTIKQSINQLINWSINRSINEVWPTVKSNEWKQ